MATSSCRSSCRVQNTDTSTLYSTVPIADSFILYITVAEPYACHRNAVLSLETPLYPVPILIHGIAGIARSQEMVMCSLYLNRKMLMVSRSVQSQKTNNSVVLTYLATCPQAEGEGWGLGQTIMPSFLKDTWEPFAWLTFKARLTFLV